MRWDVGVTAVGEVTGVGPANESAVSRRIEPPGRFTGGYQLDGGLRLASTLLPLPAAAAAALTLVATTAPTVSAAAAAILSLLAMLPDT